MEHLPSVLQNEYILRRSRNASYSKRAFAKSLNISSGALSELMEGRRKASFKLTQKIFNKLGHYPQPEKKISREILPLDKFEMISQLVHFYILNLLKTKKHPGSVPEMAKRLNVSESAVSEAINRLNKMGLIEKNRSGKWIRTSKNLDTPEQNILSPALQRAHREACQKAEAALALSPVERDFTIVVLPASADQLPMIREKIRAFQDELDSLCANGSCEEVYQINVQFFPVSNRGGKL